MSGYLMLLTMGANFFQHFSMPSLISLPEFS